jgi:hypothetical protein
MMDKFGIRRPYYLFVSMVIFSFGIIVGCTRATHVSISELEEGSIHGTFRVKTMSDEVFTVDKVSVGDSVITLDEPSGSTFGTIGYPITIEIGDVRSIERLGGSNITKVGMGIGVGLLAGLLILAFTSPITMH